ncbi:16S rRNA (guanine(527)-N(7))-methyltransferase RsmG [Paracraurococcus ruber]|uniref:Ribosomal RNA small subunit methyltransferase G n=1 Tax=Paracraurococcus ruber TaxID=77675 RepID=A0ABS1CY69_9PROT|nr:16S rRNA (guanine(527)-N(7))-methyltransferase RsmG [Paracraurococcus ruber]MBK1659483.1 16S rRNA (guanine(527)-N(7))-methyltransferase RsmG [Paracraurococcus ruber]TDG33668.1 16S rRNA (guanine(527)-N(7))-methyltransferase RsmG [Paracraurococcus ruber]
MDVPRETEERARSFIALLQRWNTRINLTAEREVEAIWHRHVLDSLQLAPLVPEGDGPLVDLGSGAGFPGLLLALATGRDTHLVESDRRKSAFLIEAARSLGLARVRVHPARIDAVTLPPAAVVTARALAPLPDLLAHAHRLLAPGGVALFPKGRTAEQELTDAARAWNMRTERFPSRTDPQAIILRLSEIRPAGPTT